MRISPAGLLGLLSFIAACNSDDGDGGAAGSGYCEVLVERSRECGFIGEGDINCTDYGDQAEACETRCLEEASCDSISTIACSTFEVSSPVGICFARCIGLEPVTCEDGLEISGWARCNGIDDCSLSSDATEVAIDEQGCESTRNRCRNVDETYPSAGYCDGVDDCSDGSDEPPDCEVLRTCEGDFGTTDVTPLVICNGIVDCTDGSDEPDSCAVRMCEGD
jgi:hypothetical protein